MAGSRSTWSLARSLRLEQLERRQLLSVSPLGPEFPVNSEAFGAQRLFSQCPAAAVAMDLDGDFAVVWSSDGQDGDGEGVYAQRFSSSGVLQGSEFLVNTHAADAQTFPSIAMDADGDFVVTWSSLFQDHDIYGVYAQRFNAAGLPQGDEFQVNTCIAGNQNYSAVAMDSDGDFVVTWTSSNQDGDRTGVFGQLYDSSGTPLGDEFQINTTTTNNQCYSSVDMDAVGNFLVTWTSQDQDGSAKGIFAQRYDATGTALGTEFQVNTTTAASQELSAVSISAAGSVVVWRGFDTGTSTWNVHAQRFDSLGVAQGGELLVGQGRNPSVALGTSNDFVIAWQSDDPSSTSPSDIYIQQYDSAGQPLQAALIVNDVAAGDQQSPSIATDGDHLAVA